MPSSKKDAPKPAPTPADTDALTALGGGGNLDAVPAANQPAHTDGGNLSDPGDGPTPEPGQFEAEVEAAKEAEKAQTEADKAKAEADAQATADAVVVPEPDLGDALHAAKGCLTTLRDTARTKGHVDGGELVEALARAEAACGQELTL